MLVSERGLILSRGAPASRRIGRGTFTGSLDTLPFPDYDDYFAVLREMPEAWRSTMFPPTLPLETSRGCWWGERSHCTFCGLNAGGMMYRAKSAKRAGAEVRHLMDRYGVRKLAAVDNIMPIKGRAELIEELAQTCDELDLFYEVKSNVRPGEVRDLAAAHIRAVQPGVESLSTEVLRLMRKGVSALSNINALRWFTTFDIFVSWNFLYGFPGETSEMYAWQAETCDRLVHLPPPFGFNPVRLDRFSPNFEDPLLKSRFSGVEPDPCYTFLYPSSLDLHSAAYFFSGMAEADPAVGGWKRAAEAVARWQSRWGSNGFGSPFARGDHQAPRLQYSRAVGRGTVVDTRWEAPVNHTLSEPQRLCLEAAFLMPTPIARLERDLSSASLTPHDVRAALASLEELALVEVDGDALVALPIADRVLAERLMAEQAAEAVALPA